MSKQTDASSVGKEEVLALYTFWNIFHCFTGQVALLCSVGKKSHLPGVHMACDAGSLGKGAVSVDVLSSSPSGGGHLGSSRLIVLWDLNMHVKATQDKRAQDSFDEMLQFSQQCRLEIQCFFFHFNLEQGLLLHAKHRAHLITMLCIVARERLISIERPLYFGIIFWLEQWFPSICSKAQVTPEVKSYHSGTLVSLSHSCVFSQVCGASEQPDGRLWFFMWRSRCPFWVMLT